MRERGSASVLAASLIAVTIVAGLALVAGTQIVIGRARAVTAADAAALAAAPVTFPPVGQGNLPANVAREFALANGARLIRCECVVLPTFAPRAVEVEVGVPMELAILGRHEIRATSRAEYVP